MEIQEGVTNFPVCCHYTIVEEAWAWRWCGKKSSRQTSDGLFHVLTGRRLWSPQRWVWCFHLSSGAQTSLGLWVTCFIWIALCKLARCSPHQLFHWTKGHLKITSLKGYRGREGIPTTGVRQSFYVSTNSDSGSEKHFSDEPNEQTAERDYCTWTGWESPPRALFDI